MLFVCTVITALIAPARLQAASPSNESWIVHSSVDIGSMERGPNRLGNPGFESGSAGWISYGQGFSVDSSVARSGSRSARLNPGSLGAAVQRVALNQPYAKPIYVTGWSKAVSGPSGCRMTYSLYIDITHTDGTTAYSPYYCYSGGTHDWEYIDRIIQPEKPVATIHIWTMFQSSSGTAWYDDLTVGEYEGDLREFDGDQIIYSVPTQRPWEGSVSHQVSSGDGLGLSLSSFGGALTSLKTDGVERLDMGSIHASGFFVRDVAAGTPYVHLGGTVMRSGDDLVFHGRDASLGLELTATFHPMPDHILIDASLRDTTGADRAISLYFAVPIASGGWTWWKDIRTGYPANSQTEHHFTLDTDWGANGRMSHYCLSSLSGPAGLALAYPMDRPAVARFAYNSSTYQFYYVAELGLSPLSSPNPRQADVQLLLYKHDAEWGFRAAFDKYVDIYPHFFTRRVAEDGIWVAHADLDGIPDIGDFGIKFHETGNSRVYAFDDSVDAYTLRYLTEPWGYWLRLPTDVDAEDYGAVMDYVHQMLSAPADNDRRWAEAILSSGIYDASGRYYYEASSEAFASHVAAFVLDGDPDLDLPGYDHTKATQSWSVNRQEPYHHPEWGILDGEYIDSFESKGVTSNFRQEHFPFIDQPLSFDRYTKSVILPQIFANYELAEWIAGDIHALDRYMMANSVLLRWAFPSHLFDIMGSERGWIHGGTFIPDPDSLLNLWRTFSYRKPYCVLQNGDITTFTHETVEQYFAYCAFYGVYPSFFTHDGGVTNYWERPDWYERDRDLYLKYIPIIKTLNAAGWEPVTGASTDNASVYVERYGSGTDFFLTLRNAANGAISTSVDLDLARLGLPMGEGYVVDELLTGAALVASLSGDSLLVPLTVPAKSSRILHIVFADVAFRDVGLVKGWNLVSLPGAPISSSPQQVFSSLSGRFDRAYAYDASAERWLSHHDGVPYVNSMSTVLPWRGMWVHALEDTAWRVGVGIQTQATIPLQAGWNLIGLPLDAPVSVPNAVASLGQSFEFLSEYDASSPDLPWRTYSADVPPELNSLQVMMPGRGYWIKVTQAVDWVVP